MPNDLPDDELLDVPFANLQPGELRRAFAVNAIAFENRQEEEIVRWRTISALQRSKEEETHHEREELHRREEILLAGLRDREKAIREDADLLDKRAIKLDDGRRVYVDRDKYRDAEGRELSGADRAQAELHHLDLPNAATWQEHQEIELRLRATKQLREKVEALQTKGDAPDISKALAAYEAEFKNEVAANQKPKESAPDYGSADYISA